MPVFNQLNQHVYHHLHDTLLHQSTRREKNLTTVMQNPVEKPSVLQPKIWNKELMYIPYLFDTSMNRDLPNQFYKWWNTYYAFPGSPLQTTKLILVASTNHTLESCFIHKKPPREILTKMEPT
ncbi:unnamed protein product [Rotaria magnacalcarata]|uniref:Uncharacterized protein n=1 Tax=Rotaria magnacalcarata TaxID=392030 RepID=A0A816T3S4_9BILA|nr:unnamed protein product [Rotaria magnacalcarata]CAF1682614.1 unnamed protein product [Rotaria magnacalcarata]CAF2096205.1 unnamed protein product [Rotaria magnacalcarata]CAF5138883.1 unnamed protein product [Rotaria magnacalcarata]CAF5143747.1 unnamed protein product [Rotaria magnacalcarata]